MENSRIHGIAECVELSDLWNCKMCRICENYIAERVKL